MIVFLLVLFVILLAGFAMVLLRMLYAGIPYDEWVEIERNRPK